MVLKLLASKKALMFIGGAVTATVGKQVLQSEKTRNMAVKMVAKGVKFREDVQETLERFKEDAQDIYADAVKSVEEKKQSEENDDV